jgi:hypothetical protein
VDCPTFQPVRSTSEKKRPTPHGTVQHFQKNVHHLKMIVQHGKKFVRHERKNVHHPGKTSIIGQKMSIIVTIGLPRINDPANG